MAESTRATSEKQSKSPKQVAPQAVRSAPTNTGATMGSGVLLAMMEPRQAAAGSILSLQRLSGNRTVTRHLQAKLTVGPVADHFELEADRVAEQVLAMPAPVASPPAPAAQRQAAPEEEEVQTKPLAAGITPLQRAGPEEEEQLQGKPLLQRAGPEEEEQLQGKPLLQRAGPEEEEQLQGKPLLQRAGPEEEEQLQGKRARPAGDGSFEAGEAVESRLSASRGGGTPLPGDVRNYMEPRFGADFGGVRVHAGSESASLNRQISAQAFTHAQDIYMGEGRYAPGTTAGNRLLAHELAHVVQQTGGAVTRKPSAPPTPAISGGSVSGVQRLFGRKKQPKPVEDQLVDDLEAHFKGYAGIKGFFTGTRKSMVTQEAQGGILTDAQERSIDMLAGMAPEKLTKLGFLLPDDARSKADELIGKPDELAKLPVKQQMQVATFISRKPISAPTPSSEEDRQKLENFRAKEDEAKRAKMSPLERGLVDKRKAMGLAPLDSEERPPIPQGPGPLPKTVTPKGGIPSSDKVVLKPGKQGEETIVHDPQAYQDLVYDYVRKAQTHQGMIGTGADQLGQDFVDVREGKDRYEKLSTFKESALVEMQALGGKPGGPMKKLMARLKWSEESQVALLKALHETDFTKADQDAERRAERAQKSSVDATQEKATIDYAYDKIVAEKKPIDERMKAASRKDKKDPVWTYQTQLMKWAAADVAKRLSQQAKLSMHVVQLRRTSVDSDVTFVQKTLDRLPGILRKLGGKIVTGVLSGVLGFLTFGLLGVRGSGDVKGFMGKGLEKKGWPIKITFLNDIRNQIAQFRTTVQARPTGPSVADVTSALLRAFNEIIVQNVINIAGKLATITGILATILMALAPISMGGTAGPAAILATISSIATFVALIAAGVKVAVNAVRLTIDGISALLNAYKYQNPHMANALVSRLKQTSMETISDTTQFAGTALGASTGNLIKGHGFTNMFNPSDIISTNVASTLAKEGPGIGLTIGGTAASTGIGTVAPLAMGILPPAITGAGKQGESYSLYTQHPDEMHTTKPTKFGGGLLPPSDQRNRLEGRSMPTKPGNTPLDPTVPPWMRAEMEKQNQLRGDVFKDRIALGASQIEAVNSKATELTGKLGLGKTESDKMQQEAKNVKAKSGKEMDSESTEMAEGQSGVLHEGNGAVKDTLSFLQHSQTELRKLPEEEKQTEGVH